MWAPRSVSTFKTVREDAKDAMKQLERKIRRAAVVQHPEPTALVN
jgi:hypothetical protein